jgi:CxxC motif-containing protein (DUF1111 family)
LRPNNQTQRTQIVVVAALLTAATIVFWGFVSIGAETIRDPADAERVAAVTRPATDFTKAESYELNAAGAATSHDPINISAFSHPSANMAFDRQLDFRVGDGIFRKLWVSAPSSTVSSDGLGPLFNARSCQSCHLKDGRGVPPEGDSVAVALFLRLSIPPETDAQREALETFRMPVIAEPTYGGQLQNFSIAGLLSEGNMVATYEPVEVELADGTIVTLRDPTYSVSDLNYGPLHPDAMLSPRLAPPMIGMGLLEDIPADDILAHADPEDSDGDGISGRANWSWNVEEDRLMLGRFGWKAGEPTIAQQSAHAFAGDIGISSAMAAAWSGDCTEFQTDCGNATDGRDPDEGVEVPQKMFDLVVFYARNLAVPARRDIDDPQVLEGKQLFYESGCIGCHVPKFVTGRETEPEQSFQLIWPYSDLLLHDMGDGLADGRPEGAADGSEWRTAPLWGLGLAETVGDGRAYYLHDGRATTILEAILWHGGEAEASKDRVVAMTKDQREALLAFLRSL